MNIEKNIPMPRKFRRKYPFAAMAVGDSIFVYSESGDVRGSVAARKYAYDQRAKGKACRFVSRREVGGERIWRVE